MTSNGKLINVYFNSSAQRLMVKTTQKLDPPGPPFLAYNRLLLERVTLTNNFNAEHAPNPCRPKATLAFCSHGEKLPRQGGSPSVEQRITRLSKLRSSNGKLLWTVTDVRTKTEAKLTLGSLTYPGLSSSPGSMWIGPKGSSIQEARGVCFS